MWLPEKIYEALPFGYAVAALLVLYLFPSSGPAELSAALLGFAAALVGYWKHSTRIQIKAMVRSSARPAAGQSIFR